METLDNIYKEYQNKYPNIVKEWKSTVKYKIYSLFGAKINPSVGWLYQYDRIQNRKNKKNNNYIKIEV